MTDCHLFSDPLFELLFQHNLVSSDGYVIANEEELKEFSAFFARQKRQKTSEIYEERKEIVDEVIRIVKAGNLGHEELNTIKILLIKLNIGIDQNGHLIKLNFPKIGKNIGAPEPNQSFWELKYFDEIERKRVLRKNLRALDEWMEEISQPWVKADKTPYVHSVEDEMRYRARTNRRMDRMAKDRRRMIERLYEAEKKEMVSKKKKKKPRDRTNRKGEEEEDDDEEREKNEEEKDYSQDIDSLESSSSEDIVTKKKEWKGRWPLWMMTMMGFCTRP